MGEKTEAQYAEEVARVRASLPAARTQLECISGVVRVMVGLKETGGMATEHVVFQVYVQKKKRIDHVAPSERIPVTVAGVPTDVIALEGEPSQILCGGITMTQHLWGLTVGTLGAVALTTDTNPHLAKDTPVFVTNHHVASDVGDVVGLTCLCDSWCCECCEFGRVIDARQTDRVDGAIGTMNAGIRFSHEILGIGAVRGTATATIGMEVLKYGIKSGLTTGRVSQDTFEPFHRTDNVTLMRQIRTPPIAPSKTMQEPGDSGSVLVHAGTRSVVGLTHSRQTGGICIGSHIDDVTALLHFSFPVMGTPGAIPLDGLALDPEQPTMLTALAQYRRELEQTESGRLWLELVRAHAAEVRHLVNHQRETQVAWHRSQGPSFIAHYTRNARDPAHRVPREIGGVRLENLIISMATVLQRHGSPELARAITDHYLTTLQFAQSADSVRSVLAGARRIAGA